MIENALEIVWGEYFRLMAYAIVIISIFFEIKTIKHYSRVLFIGDIIFAVLAFSSIIYSQITGLSEVARLIFITPSAIIWASAHVINLSIGDKERK